MNKKQESLTELYQRVKKLIELSKTVVENSKIISEEERRDYLADYQQYEQDAKEYLETKNRDFMRQLEEEILTPWNETQDEDSQHFWQLAKQQGEDVEQTDYLSTILTRGRIANFKEYDIVQDSIVVWQQEGRITKKQAEELDAMLGEYEQKRSL